MNKLLQKSSAFVLIVLVVFTIIRIIGSPMSLKASSEMCLRGCHSNIRLIEGAIEAYNMDHSDAHIKYSTPFAEIESLLVDSGYLKSAVRCPGSYGYEKNSFLRFIYGIYLHAEGLPLPPGDYSMPPSESTGHISCSLHGAI